MIIMVCIFQRHFAVFRLPAPPADSLFTIVTSILEVSTNTVVAPIIFTMAIFYYLITDSVMVFLQPSCSILV